MILSILEELANNSSRNKKLEILSSNASDNNLERLFDYAYNKNYLYGLRDPGTISSNKDKDSDIDAIFNFLDKAIKKELRPNSLEIQEEAQKVLDGIGSGYGLLFRKILDRDLQVGVSPKTYEKVWIPKTYTYSVSLCEDLDDKTVKHLKFPCILQCKFDGARCYHEVDGTTVKSFSRNNKPIRFSPNIQKQLLTLYENLGCKGVYYFDGEALYKDTNDDRKSSNGYFNKLVRDTATEDERDYFKLMLWDYHKLGDKRPYSERIKTLEKAFIDNDYRNLNYPANYTINNMDEAYELNDRFIADGEEGSVIKNRDWIWCGKRTKSLLKLKAEYECELRIIGLQEGKKSRKGLLGAFICATEDGLVQVNISGFTEEQQKEFFDEDMIGKIITVRYNYVIKAKNSDIYKLYLPRFVMLRLDKDEANYLSDLNTKTNNKTKRK